MTTNTPFASNDDGLAFSIGFDTTAANVNGSDTEYFAATNPAGEWCVYLSTIYGETMVRACADKAEASSLAKAMNADLETLTSEDLEAAQSTLNDFLSARQ